MSTARISFIGGGNMAQALIGGLIQAGHQADHLRVADPSPEQRERLDAQFGITSQKDNAETVAGSQAVVLAVKPQVMSGVLASIRDALPAEAVVISVAAGTTLGALSAGLGEAVQAVRAMPNTPALFGAGITGLVANSNCSSEGLALAETILGTAGEVVRLNRESQMDAVTAVSGSGPAYYFAFTEHLAEAGARAGLPPEVALKLARQTAIGAGVMLAQSEVDAAELRRRVTSPGGTTEAALKRFAASKMAQMIEQAVDAAVKRGKELGAD
ncbi:MAG: pyrroline-5-carboxylate reductase [Pseudomonadota bacterium]